MLVITHLGEEDSKPIAIIDSMEQVESVILNELKGWACPPEGKVSIRQDTNFPFEDMKLFRVWEEDYIYDDWNCYTVTDVPHLKI